jgi:hypothetical protein
VLNLFCPSWFEVGPFVCTQKEGYFVCLISQPVNWSKDMIKKVSAKKNKETSIYRKFVIISTKRRLISSSSLQQAAATLNVGTT